MLEQALVGIRLKNGTGKDCKEGKKLESCVVVIENGKGLKAVRDGLK